MDQAVDGRCDTLGGSEMYHVPDARQHYDLGARNG
jgi:hypothetical protein